MESTTGLLGTDSGLRMPIPIPRPVRPGIFLKGFCGRIGLASPVSAVESTAALSLLGGISGVGMDDTEDPNEDACDDVVDGVSNALKMVSSSASASAARAGVLESIILLLLLLQVLVLVLALLLSASSGEGTSYAKPSTSM